MEMLYWVLDVLCLVILMTAVHQRAESLASSPRGRIRLIGYRLRDPFKTHDMLTQSASQSTKIGTHLIVTLRPWFLPERFSRSVREAMF